VVKAAAFRNQKLALLAALGTPQGPAGPLKDQLQKALQTL
jgi:hypothetical protein